MKLSTKTDHHTGNSMPYSLRLVCVVFKETLGTLSRDDDDVDENGTKKLHSCFLNKFAMIYTHLLCEMWPNYPGANVVGAALKFRKRNENLPSCVHVLHKTLNLVISRRCFAEDGKEMHQRVLCTCRASVLLIKTIVS